MKKRLLSALLALALVFVLLPTTALADTTPVTDENVKINGTAVIVGNDISLGEGNGTYSYDKATHTLTLNSATINATDSNIGIDFCDTTNYVTYSVILTGENTVTSNNIAIETTPNTNLTFTGGGNLKAITNGYYQAIRVYGTLTIDNSTLIAESSAYTATTVIWTLAMTGNNAKLEISNKSAANIVAGTAGPASNIDWSNYQFTTGSYSGDALTESDPEVCSWGTLKKYFGYPTKEYSQYICIAKRTIPALQRTSDVLIAGENAVVGVETSIPSANGSGTYFYDQASKTLTLNNVNIASSSIINGIQFTKDGTYTIKLVGTNTMSGFSTGISADSADQYVSNINITVTGAGSLEVSATKYAIAMNKGDLKFENTGEIKLTTSNINETHNVLSVNGNISITDMSKYSVTGTQQTGGKPLGSEVSLTEASQLKGGTTGYRIITITPAALEESNVYVAGTKLYKNTAYTIKDGKPVIGGTYPDNYNIYFDTTTTNWTLHVKNAVIDATGTTGIYGTSNIVFEGTNSITASSYGIYSYFTSSDLKISGSGSLMIKTIAACPAIATDYNTSRSIIISGNNFTVTADTSKTTSYAIKSDNDLTIKDGAIVIAKSNATRAIDIKGNLTVTNAALTATSTSTKPTVQVGGNASFTGSTVTITNNSTELHKDATEATKGDSVSSALYVKGNINITDNANVTAKVENGGGNAIGALGNITVNGSNVTAANRGQKFTTIIAENVYISGESTITANNLNGNPVLNNWYLTYPAIEGNIVNKNTDYSLKFEGQHNGTSVPKTTLAPGEQTTLYYYKVTITRGDEVTRTESPVVIAGTTLLNDTYYTITNGSTVAEGTESNYNAFYNSTTKTLKLNNASINGAGTNKAIEANVGGYTFTIELVGNNIIKTSGFANNVIDITGNLYFTGSGTAEVSGKGTPIYATYKIDVSADVTITNTEKAGSFTFSAYGENSSNYKGANTFAIGAGYTAYATTDKTTWAVYDNTTASENESYTTLRITKENLAPTTPTPQTPFTIDGIPAQFVDGGMIATTGVTATSSNNINLPIDRVKWYTFTPVFGSDGRMDSVSDKTEATGNFEAGKYYVVEIKFVQDLSPFESWDMKVSGWSDNDVYRQSVTARNDIEIYFLTPASAATHEHNWAEKYDTVYHWKMCTYDGCTAIKDKAPHEWVGWRIDEPSRGMHNRFCNCGYNDYSHHYNLAYAAAGEAGHYQYCTLGNCTFKTSTVPHNYDGDTCTICNYTKSGEIVPPTPDNPGTIVIIRPAEEEKPAQQPNPSTGANDLVGLAVAAAVAAALGSAALLRKHD